MAAGSALYAFPFLIPALAFVLLVSLILRGIFAGPRMRMRHAFAARWQNMSDAHRAAMRGKFAAHGCGPRHPMGGQRNDTDTSNP